MRMCCTGSNLRGNRTNPKDTISFDQNWIIACGSARNPGPMALCYQSERRYMPGKFYGEDTGRSVVEVIQLHSRSRYLDEYPAAGME